jgi:hypothetical protein
MCQDKHFLIVYSVFWGFSMPENLDTMTTVAIGSLGKAPSFLFGFKLWCITCQYVLISKQDYKEKKTLSEMFSTHANTSSHPLQAKWSVLCSKRHSFISIPLCCLKMPSRKYMFDNKFGKWIRKQRLKLPARVFSFGFIYDRKGEKATTCLLSTKEVWNLLQMFINIG